jgi:hypothetical protein
MGKLLGPSKAGRSYIDIFADKGLFSLTVCIHEQRMQAKRRLAKNTLPIDPAGQLDEGTVVYARNSRGRRLYRGSSWVCPGPCGRWGRGCRWRRRLGPLVPPGPGGPWGRRGSGALGAAGAAGPRGSPRLPGRWLG